MLWMRSGVPLTSPVGVAILLPSKPRGLYSRGERASLDLVVFACFAGLLLGEADLLVGDLPFRAGDRSRERL